MKKIFSISIFILLILLSNCSNAKNNNTENKTTLENVKLPKLLCFTRAKDSYSSLQSLVLDTIGENYFGKVHIEIIDIDSNNEFIDSFNLKFIPTIILIEKNDSVVAKIEGYKPSIELLHFFRRYNFLQDSL